MLVTRRRLAAQLSDITAVVQRLQNENETLKADVARLRSRMEGDQALRSMLAHTASAVLSAPVVGEAIEGFARAMRLPLKRGRAGGFARASQVRRLGERWPSSGQFMAHSDWEQIEREIAEAEYMRYAAGGFARASKARRFANGSFAPRYEEKP